MTEQLSLLCRKECWEVGGNNRRLWKAAQLEPWRGWGVSYSCEMARFWDRESWSWLGGKSCRKGVLGVAPGSTFAEVQLALSMMF